MEEPETAARRRANTYMGWNRWPDKRCFITPWPPGVEGSEVAEIAHVSDKLGQYRAEPGSAVALHRASAESPSEFEHQFWHGKTPAERELEARRRLEMQRWADRAFEQMAQEQPEPPKPIPKVSEPKRAVWDSFPNDVFAGVVVGLLLGLIGAAASDQQWLYLPLACVAFLAALAVGIEWYRRHNLGDEKERRRSISTASYVAVTILVALFVVWIVGRHSQVVAVGSSPPSAAAGSQPVLVPMREQFSMFRGTKPDVKGRVVFKLVLVNTSQVTAKAHIYSDVEIRPFVSLTADSSIIENEILEAKREVRKRFDRHFVEEVSIEPGSLVPGGRNFTYFAVGPFVTDAQWKRISSGDRYVYFYSLVAVNDDPSNPSSVPLCGIGNGDVIDGCMPELEKW